MITICLIAIGFICLFVNWILVQSNTITINPNEITQLRINTVKRLSDLTEEIDVEYYGNFLTLRNNEIFEINRAHIIELKNSINKDLIEIEYIGQKFYQISPKQLLKGLINMP